MPFRTIFFFRISLCFLTKCDSILQSFYGRASSLHFRSTPAPRTQRKQKSPGKHILRLQFANKS